MKEEEREEEREEEEEKEAEEVVTVSYCSDTQIQIDGTLSGQPFLWTLS